MARWQRVRIPVPKGISADARESIGEAIIDQIRDRADRGLGVQAKGDGTFAGKRFPKYSDEYRKQKGQSNVDLYLSGEMLESLEVLSSKPGSVLIGMPRGDSELNGKAEGNRLGSYGGSPNPSKARDFLGIPKTDMAKILRSAAKEDDKIKAKAREFVRSLSAQQREEFS